MPRDILINMFNMNTVGHQSPGLWKHPRDRSRDYRDLETWVDLAKTLERGLVDGLFLADVLGVYDVYGGSPDTALRAGAQVPVNDPMLLVSAMAAVTSNLGFGVTCNLGYETPYVLARRMSTLDHLTKGRMGWNIVTGYLDSAARGIGQSQQPGHDRRYDQADEFMQIVYRLWEGSWQDGAVVLDRERKMFTDPSKVRPVRHKGEFYEHRRHPSERTLAAANACSVPGRGIRARAPVCCGKRRVRFCQRADCQGGGHVCCWSYGKRPN